MRYSVIVPIYNAEKTLRRCLDSLLPQLNNEIEVLLINDGSKDMSGDICKEYVSRCSCFKYFEQENAGVSVARNKGLDNAIGEYILFVDSDDFVELKYFDSIEECIKIEEPDLLIFGATFINRKNNYKICYDNRSYLGKKCAKKITILAKNQEMYSLWNKVFLNRVIDENKIRFNQKLNLGEDGSFIFEYTLYTKKLTTIKAVLYQVDESNQKSLSRKKRKYLYDDLISTAKNMESLLLSSSLDKKSMRFFKNRLSRGYYRGAYSCFFEASKWTANKNELKKEIKKICTVYKKNRIKPVGIEVVIISIPVEWKLTHLIWLLIKLKK